MITIQLDNQDYKMPDNWSEVNLERLMKLNDIQKKKWSNDIDMTAHILNTLCDIPVDSILDLSLSDFTQVAELLTWMDKLPTEKVESIKIDDIEYIPVNLQNLTAGEYISLEVFQKEDVDANLHFITSILIRPKVGNRIEKLGDMIDIGNRAQLFKEKLMVGDLWPIVDGFFNGAALSSLTNTQDSSDQAKNQSRLKIVSS